MTIIFSNVRNKSSWRLSRMINNISNDKSHALSLRISRLWTLYRVYYNILINSNKIICLKKDKKKLTCIYLYNHDGGGYLYNHEESVWVEHLLYRFTGLNKENIRPRVETIYWFNFLSCQKINTVDYFKKIKLPCIILSPIVLHLYLLPLSSLLEHMQQPNS